MLEQLIHDFNGSCNPIRTYSVEELKKATDNYHCDRIIYEGWNYQFYRAIHEDRQILVKTTIRRSDRVIGDPVELITNEVAIASSMSNHKNVLKLLGCCLETELPILVFEFPAKGNLALHIYRDSDHLLPWQVKLKIAIEVADAVAYLHQGMSKVIIHRDIHVRCIFLDQDYAAKLSDFQVSLPIPSGETHVDLDDLGIVGYASPEVVRHGRYTEKSDVYNLGMVLCEILTGKSIHNVQVVPPRLLEGNILEERNMRQVIECSKLALRCIESDPNERPTMQEVSQALRLIKTFQQ